MVASGLHHYNAVAVLFILGTICTHSQEHCHRAQGAKIWRNSEVTHQEHAGLPKVAKQSYSIAVRGSPPVACDQEKSGMAGMTWSSTSRFQSAWPAHNVSHDVLRISAHWTEGCLQKPCCWQAEAVRAAEDPSMHVRDPFLHVMVVSEEGGLALLGELFAGF